MSRSSSGTTSWRWWAASAVLLGSSYALLPLFSSNQNHHFLIGLARAGEGWLADDWLASTIDPFPLFTTYVTLVHRYASDVLHYVVYLALFGAYGYGLMRIAEHLWPVRPDSAVTARLAFLAVLCVLHNEVIGYLVGLDPAHLAWWQMTHWGVAEQELFGHGAFQASSFGMLLPLAIAWFLDGRRFAAALLAASVVAIHFSYALPVAAILVGSGVRPRNSDPRGSVNPPAATIRRFQPVILGSDPLWFLLFLLPPAVDVLWRLGPTSGETSTAAAAILVRHLPQETMVSHWVGWKAALQIAWMLFGIELARGTPLMPMLAVPFAAGTLLTAAQLALDSPQLALLFPWRVSVLLVPIATALAARKAIAVFLLHADRSRVRTLGIAATAALAVSALIGIGRMTLHFAYFYGDRRITAATDRVLPARWRDDFARVLEHDALPMMQHVRATAAHGDLYVIPPELERFRVVTGAPALADLKSHPYKDVEVLEWRTRLDATKRFYEASETCGAMDALAEASAVTHVVVDRRRRQIDCDRWTATYEDDRYAVYRIRPTPMLK